MPLSNTIKSLLIITLMLATHAATASTTSTSDYPARIELRELGGLKALFLRLHRHVEAQFGANKLNRILLESPDAYRGLLNRSSTSQQQSLKNAYIRLLGEWQQFQLVTTQVLGTDSDDKAKSYAHSFDAFIKGASVKVAAKHDSTARDRNVARMEMLGYTTREISDVINGNISLQALKKSGQMRALGYDQKIIAAYLERHYKGEMRTANELATKYNSLSALPLKQRTVAPSATTKSSKQRQRLELYVRRYARIYGIDANLVRAVITNESSWRIKARSAVGAIGPMQLMPSTAKLLGVDPHEPEQNIEGGVRYLTELLELFDGDIDATLVSYNAGPGHARNWRKGATVLYGETRDYLQRVKSSYAQLTP